MSDRYIKNTLNNVKRERLMSITNIFVMTITFILLGIFITVITISQTILRNLEQQAQVTIFFKDDFSEEKILGLEQKLSEDDRIFSVNYISKDDAYNIFKEINKDDPVLLESVTSGILPASLEIRAKNIANLPKLAEEFNSLDGAEEVRFFSDVVGSFRKFSVIAYVVGFSLVLIFLVISYAVVISTLRTTINSKGVELEIMKLVGARAAYVRMPLIYQGVFYGVVSSFIAGAVILALLLILAKVGFIPASLSFGFASGAFISAPLYAFILWFLLILSGTLLGYFGSSFAVKRYLKY